MNAHSLTFNLGKCNYLNNIHTLVLWLVIYCVALYNKFHLVTTETGNLHLQMSYIVSDAAVLLLAKFKKCVNLLKVDLENLL